MSQEKKKILLVDDEEDILSMVKMRLAAAGYEVITSGDGKQAYALAKQAEPDLIILDLMLPGMEGHMVCRFLKFDDKYKHIPIIILTARGQKQDIEMCKSVGADFYFNKPVNFKDLLAKIAEFIGPITAGSV